MGRRSAGETLARILLAFARKPVWSQADLAAMCEVSVRTVKTRLLDLQGAGFHVSAEKDPPHVYWTAPEGWFPGGRVVREADASLIVRLLHRVPETASVRRALRAVEKQPREPLSSERQSDSELRLGLLEDAARERKVVELDYYTASRDAESRRSISIHRIFHGPHVRVLATCHQSGMLKFFRGDRMRSVRLTGAEAFRPTSEAEVDALLSTSVNWFHRPGGVVVCRFSVRLPEARWVTANLPVAPFVEQPVPGGVRIELRTTALDLIARFVVGLGDAAQVETPELQRAVTMIARRALAAATRSGAKPRQNRAARHSTK